MAREIPPALRAKPFAAAQAIDVTRRQLQGRGYVRLARGAYWVSGQDVTYGRRIQAFMAVLPERTVLCELAAAWALGVDATTRGDDIIVNLVPAGSARSRAGLHVRAQCLPQHQVMRTPLGLATSPARTAADLLRTLPRDRAVAAADALLRRARVEPSQVLDTLLQQPRTRGNRPAIAHVQLLDPGAESPRESLLRLLVHDARLPAPVTQHEVRDAANRFVARLDLAWPELKVAVEYDGAHHRERRQHSADLARHNRLRAAGWVVVQVDAASLARPAELLALLRSLLQHP